MSHKVKSIYEVIIPSINEKENHVPNFKFLGTFFKYDENGNKIEVILHDKTGKVIGVSKYRYDNKGNQVEYVTYDSQGISLGGIEYRYDNKGNRTIEHRYTERDRGGNPCSPEPVSVVYFDYNDRNKCIERRKVDRNGTYENHSTYSYNELGNLVEEKVLGFFEELISSIEFLYDEYGSCIEERKTTHFYNKRGERLDKKEEETISYKYQYDEKRLDWIKCMKYVQGVFTEIIVREIEYENEIEYEYKVDPDLPF